MDTASFYKNRRRRLWEMYWMDNDGTDILRPNGFREYPEEIYNLFLELIDHDGKVIDLGCGNGLLLRHIVTKSRYKLVPYGIDFLEESIKQAKTMVLPQYADNFVVGNIVDVDLEVESYDFIFFDPYNVHPDDLNQTVYKIIRSCRKGGKVIFYTYRDVLRILKIINIFRFKIIRWVGDLLPKDVSSKLTRIDHRDVSIGVLKK